MAKIFEVVLELGNFLNENTSRGGAFGFTLNSLNKIHDTRSTDLSLNLLQWCADLLQRKDSDLLNFMEELPNVEPARKINLPNLRQELNNLTKDFSEINDIINHLKESEAKDNFSTKMINFVTDVKEEIDSMNKKLEEALEYFEKAAIFLGEDEKRATPEEIFSIIYGFHERIQASIKEVENHKVEVEKQIKREAAKMKRVLFPNSFFLLKRNFFF